MTQRTNPCTYPQRPVCGKKNSQNGPSSYPINACCSSKKKGHTSVYQYSPNRMVHIINLSRVPHRKKTIERFHLLYIWGSTFHMNFLRSWVQYFYKPHLLGKNWHRHRRVLLITVQIILNFGNIILIHSLSYWLFFMDITCLLIGKKIFLIPANHSFTHMQKIIHKKHKNKNLCIHVTLLLIRM